MALQGMDLEVNDLDIQSDGPAADRPAELLRSEGRIGGIETNRKQEDVVAA